MATNSSILAGKSRDCFTALYIYLYIYIHLYLKFYIFKSIYCYIYFIYIVLYLYSDTNILLTTYSQLISNKDDKVTQ